MPELLRPSTTDGFSTGDHRQHNFVALSRKPNHERHGRMLGGCYSTGRCTKQDQGVDGDAVAGEQVGLSALVQAHEVQHDCPLA